MIRTLAGVTAAGLGVAGWSVWEARQFQRSFHHLSILPAGMEPVRILNISDIHLMPNDGKKVEFLRDLTDLKPDAVFLTGDQLSSTKALPSLLRALKPLADLGIPGAFVYGSHDYFAPVWKNPLSYVIPQLASEAKEPEDLPHEAMAEALVDYGWTDLRNARATLSLGGTEIGLVGVDDPHIDLDDYPTQPASSLPFTIGLTHAPYSRVLNRMNDDGVGLALAGHTHGGQVCVPGYGALVTNCDLDTKHVSGVFGWPIGKRTMSAAISRGLGTSPYAPFRLACRPEIQVIDLA
ncbi:metallophosphoesterase [Flaviflexus massiliensis]|uniref:metallophosphoesterase n=1 Tax=Flaviflexus massiliensis TaxID=1522309 RepID=UPI0006D59681|nr:metallophosphoesterase [Flaviflexus massiliensis]